jgi:hypothetical protein
VPKIISPREAGKFLSVNFWNCLRSRLLRKSGSGFVTFKTACDPLKSLNRRFRLGRRFNLARLSIRNQRGEEMDYAIVGVDETDWERNHISWLSPIAKALLKRRVGEHVRFRTPAGEQNWEIIRVVHEDAVF